MLGYTAILKQKADAIGSTAGMGTQSPEPFIDAFRRRRMPAARELLKELKNTAFSCIAYNSTSTASFPSMVYIKTSPGFPMPKSCQAFQPMPMDWKMKHKMDKRGEGTRWTMVTKASKEQFALPVHPLQMLFQKANKYHSGFNFWSLTSQYQEIFGIAYWWIIYDPLFQMPMEIRVLPTHWVEPRRDNYTITDPWESLEADYYQVRLQTQGRWAQLDIPARNELGRPNILALPIHFDPNNPFEGGRSPLHASFENVTLQSEYIAHRQALYANRARPDVIVSPAGGEYWGEEERNRTKKEWVQEYRRGGVGTPHFSNTPLNVQILGWVESQIALLAEHGATKEDILNGFGLPVSFYTRETNMANLVASTELYMRGTIRPRNYARDEIITSQLCPIYDPTGQLFVSSEDPVPEDKEAIRLQEEADLKNGTRTINEVRSERGLLPVAWGELPWLPTYLAPADMQLIWDERAKIANASNDAADAVESVRTRDRPEDINKERPMSEYGHAEVHTGMKSSKNGSANGKQDTGAKKNKSLHVRHIERGQDGLQKRIVEEWLN